MLPFLNGGGLNGLNGLNGVSRPPPSRVRPASPPSTLFSDLSHLMMGGQSQPPPQPQRQPPRLDSLKDWQGLKKHFPNINISFSSGAPPGRFPAGPAARHPAHPGPAPPALPRFIAQPPKPPRSQGTAARRQAGTDGGEGCLWSIAPALRLFL